MATKKKYILEIDADVSGIQSGLEDVNTEVNQIKESVGETTENFDGLTSAADNMTGGIIGGFKAGLKGVKGMILGLKTLKGAIIATGIGALVLVIGALVNAVQQNAEANREWAKTTKALSATFIDFKVNMAQAVLGAKSLEEAIDDTASAYNRAKNITDAYVTSMNVLRVVTNKLVIDNANLRRAIELEQQIIDDTTLSHEERREALIRQNEASEQLIENKNAQINREIELNEIALKNFADGTAEREELERTIANQTAERIAGETELLRIRAENRKKAREIDLEEVNTQKAINATLRALDIELITDEEARIRAEAELQKESGIAELKANKATQEQIQAFTNKHYKALENRLREHREEMGTILAEINTMSLETLQEDNAKIVQSELDKEKEITANLMNETLERGKLELEAAERKKKVDEGITQDRIDNNRLNAQMAIDAIGALSAITEAFGNESEASARKRFKANKAFSISTALINTGLAVTAALTTGGDITKAATGRQFVEAAIAGTMGLAQVAKIAKTQFRSSGGGSGSSISAPSSAISSNNAGAATPPSVDFGFLQDGADQGGIRAYVVSQETTSAAQANQLIEDQASL